ncbi:T-cell immunoreceptor with Ig and ITIM domains [Galemys pyrenaicus]|nr:T-cell immunoreceptor with Ig and ITIM domains [Galemys pyrenaicus]
MSWNLQTSVNQSLSGSSHWNLPFAAFPGLTDSQEQENSLICVFPSWSFFVAHTTQFVCLLRVLSDFDTVFAVLGFSETLFPYRLSFTLPSAVGQFRWQKWPHALPVGPLSRSMQWCFLLFWAQGLRQASFADSGAVAGKIVTAGNMSAEEGGSITLHCHLCFTTAEVVQVDWHRQEQLLAICNSNLGCHIHSSQVASVSNFSLVLQSLTMNDTGEYFCTYYTYPGGISKGRLFLQVLQNSGAEWSPGFQIPLLGALAAVLLGLCTVVVVVARKKKFLRTHTVERDLRRVASEQENGSPRSLSFPGSYVQAPVSLYREESGDDYAEPHDYFNVLSYRSLGSFSLAPGRD